MPEVSTSLWNTSQSPLWEEEDGSDSEGGDDDDDGEGGGDGGYGGSGGDGGDYDNGCDGGGIDDSPVAMSSLDDFNYIPVNQIYLLLQFLKYFYIAFITGGLWIMTDRITHKTLRRVNHKK